MKKIMIITFLLLSGNALTQELELEKQKIEGIKETVAFWLMDESL